MNPWPEDAIVAAEASLNNMVGPISSKDIVDTGFYPVIIYTSGYNLHILLTI